MNFQSFVPDEKPEVTRELSDETKNFQLKANNVGTLALAKSFGEHDHSKARFAAAGQGCKVSLEFDVGPEAQVKR